MSSPYGNTPNPYDGPQPGPVPPAQAPAKKKSVGRIIALVAGGLVLLLAIGGTVAYLTLGDKITDVAVSTKIRLVMPDQLGGRERNNQPEFVAPTNELVTMLKQSQPAATSTIGGFYGTAEKQDLAMVAGTSGVDLDSAHTLDEVVKGMNTSLPLSDMKNVEPGPLGGQAKCGSANASGVPIGVCLWTDGGSTGMLLLYFKSADEAAAEFITNRGQVEQVS